LIKIEFNTAVKLKSIILTGPNNAPKKLRLFANKSSMDFSNAENDPFLQELILDSKQTTSPTQIPLNFVKFQKVNSVTIFVMENQDGSSETEITRLTIFGQAIAHESAKLDPKAMATNSRISSTDINNNYYS